MTSSLCGTITRNGTPCKNYAGVNSEDKTKCFLHQPKTAGPIPFAVIRHTVAPTLGYKGETSVEKVLPRTAMNRKQRTISETMLEERWRQAFVVAVALQQPQRFKCVLFGKSGSGKTTYIKHMLGMCAPDYKMYSPTIGADVHTFRFRGVDFSVWDIGCNEKLNNPDMSKGYFIGAQCALFFVRSDRGDNTSGKTRMNKRFKAERETHGKIRSTEFPKISELVGVPLSTFPIVLVKTQSTHQKDSVDCTISTEHNFNLERPFEILLEKFRAYFIH
jgi:GTPase SAR1 family protein